MDLPFCCQPTVKTRLIGLRTARDPNSIVRSKAPSVGLGNASNCRGISHDIKNRIQELAVVEKVDEVERDPVAEALRHAAERCAESYGIWKSCSNAPYRCVLTTESDEITKMRGKHRNLRCGLNYINSVKS